MRAGKTGNSRPPPLSFDQEEGKRRKERRAVKKVDYISIFHLCTLHSFSLSLFSISVSLSLFFLLQRTGKRTLEDGRARIFLFERSSGRESEKENDFPKKKEERKKERRKKRYTRGGSWEKRNLRKVIRSHRSKETRVRKVSKSLAMAKYKMHFRTRPFVFYTRKKI